MFPITSVVFGSSVLQFTPWSETTTNPLCTLVVQSAAFGGICTILDYRYPLPVVISFILGIWGDSSHDVMESSVYI